MPVTAKTLALKLGLSQSTVSRILNGDPRQRISADTRARVLEAARLLDYRPNAVARSLRHGRTNIIGLYTRTTYDVRNHFLAEILGGMQHACARHEQDLLLQTARRDKSAEVIFNSLRDGRIDGLIVHNSQEDPLVQRLAHAALVRPETAIPVVAIADPDPVLPVVTCEDSLGMELLVHELLRRGYTRFAFLEPQFKLSSVESRKQAWKKTLLAAGVLETALLNIEIDGESAESALSDDRLLTGERYAVSCWNDQSAYSLLSTCFRRGISVPGDLAITGFDGLLDPRVTDRRLVTVDCRWANAASTAVDLLMQLISGESVADETRMPVFLTLGDTI